MNIITTITEKDFDRETHPELWDTYETRTAARAILVDQDFRIALMHVTNRGYYKLPGGGVDEGESLKEALVRELKEEAGADKIEIVSEIGEIVEYREEWQKKGIHSCYLVKLTGALSDAQQTEKELDHGYKVIWANNADEAIQLVASGKPQEYGQDFERLRELSFLNDAKSRKLIH